MMMTMLKVSVGVFFPSYFASGVYMTNRKR
jgi:hypothetical protein